MRPEDHEMEQEPAPPNREDACMVCDKIDCVCPPEEDIRCKQCGTVTVYSDDLCEECFRVLHPPQRSHWSLMLYHFASTRNIVGWEFEATHDEAKARLQEASDARGTGQLDIEDFGDEMHCFYRDRHGRRRRFANIQLDLSCHVVPPRKGVTTEEFNRMFAQEIRKSGGVLVAKERATEAFRKQLNEEVEKYAPKKNR